jgi:hypothetical protein
MKPALLVVCLVAACQAAEPNYSVRRTSAEHAPLLAGDPRDWAPAEQISWGPLPYRTTFRALWHERGLYLRFDADDRAPWYTLTQRDQHLWEEEVVEIFLDVTGSGRNYAEIEINPANVICDVLMVRPSPDKLIDLSWNFEGLESRTLRQGTNWSALLFLPWGGFRALPGTDPQAIPPRSSTAWRFNVFRIERPHAPEQPQKDAIFAAWSPTGEPSFHVPAAFRDFVFAP